MNNLFEIYDQSCIPGKLNDHDLINFNYSHSISIQFGFFTFMKKITNCVLNAYTPLFSFTTFQNLDNRNLCNACTIYIQHSSLLNNTCIYSNGEGLTI